MSFHKQTSIKDYNERHRKARQQSEAQAIASAKALGYEPAVEDAAAAADALLDGMGIPPAADNGTWQPGEYVKAGFVRDHGGKTYECLQAHCTQADWTPDKTPALWAEKKQEGAAWVQPTGGHDAYAKGAIVTHKGKTWISTADANVWEPGVYGWNEYKG